MTQAHSSGSSLPSPGSPIDVWSSYEGSWSSGFEVAEVVDTDDGTRVRVRRLYDGAVLPVLFAPDQLNTGSP